jgi:hypothetical protein
MKSGYYYSIAILMVIIFSTSCNQFTYTPRSKKQQQVAKPSVVLLDNIIHFRENFNEWPSSKEYFMSKGTRYLQSFNGWKYLTTGFTIADNDNMVFYFSNHIKDEEAYKTTNKIDLNSLGGEVKFYKENGKFMWKIKMY